MKEVSIENVDAWNALKAENQRLRKALEQILSGRPSGAILMCSGDCSMTKDSLPMKEHWRVMKIAEQQLNQTGSEGE